MRSNPIALPDIFFHTLAILGAGVLFMVWVADPNNQHQDFPDFLVTEPLLIIYSSNHTQFNVEIDTQGHPTRFAVHNNTTYDAPAYETINGIRPQYVDDQSAFAEGVTWYGPGNLALTKRYEIDPDHNVVQAAIEKADGPQAVLEKVYPIKVDTAATTVLIHQSKQGVLFAIRENDTIRATEYIGPCSLNTRSEGLTGYIAITCTIEGRVLENTYVGPANFDDIIMALEFGEKVFYSELLDYVTYPIDRIYHALSKAGVEGWLMVVSVYLAARLMFAPFGIWAWQEQRKIVELRPEILRINRQYQSHDIRAQALRHLVAERGISGRRTTVYSLIILAVFIYLWTATSGAVENLNVIQVIELPKVAIGMLLGLVAGGVFLKLKDSPALISSRQYAAVLISVVIASLMSFAPSHALLGLGVIQAINALEYVLLRLITVSDNLNA